MKFRRRWLHRLEAWEGLVALEAQMFYKRQHASGVSARGLIRWITLREGSGAVEAQQRQWEDGVPQLPGTPGQQQARRRSIEVWVASEKYDGGICRATAAWATSPQVSNDLEAGCGRT